MIVMGMHNETLTDLLGEITTWRNNNVELWNIEIQITQQPNCGSFEAIISFDLPMPGSNIDASKLTVITTWDEYEGCNRYIEKEALGWNHLTVVEYERVLDMQIAFANTHPELFKEEVS